MQSSAEEAKELLIHHLGTTGDRATEVRRVVDLIIWAAVSEASAQMEPSRPRVRITPSKIKP